MMGIPGGIRQGTQTDSRCVSAVLFLKLKDRYPRIYYIVFSIVLCARNISQYFSRRLKVKVKSLSRVRLFVTPWIVAYQAPLSTEFSRQEYWSGLPFPSPGDRKKEAALQ